MENKQLVVKELEDLINSSLESKFDGDILRTYDLKYSKGKGFKGFDNSFASLLETNIERVYITQLDYSIVPTTYACKVETTYLGYLDISDYSGLDLMANVLNLVILPNEILEK